MSLTTRKMSLGNLLGNNTDVSIEHFQNICFHIYDYSNIYENMNLSTSLYYICDYFDNLLDGPQREMVTSFLMSFSLYYDKNKSRMESLELYFYDLIPDYMFFCSEDEKPYFHRVFKPLERQTNYQPPNHRHNEILVFKSQLSMYIDDNISIYSGINHYINKVTLEIMELHSNILVLELARYGKQTGTALDIVINYLYDGLTEKKRVCRHWCSFVSEIPMQHIEKIDDNHDYSLCSQLHKKRQILDYNHTYGLPNSVLLESAHNPHLWKYVNKKKVKHSVFTMKIELKPPQIVNGRLVLDR